MEKIIFFVESCTTASARKAGAEARIISVSASRPSKGRSSTLLVGTFCRVGTMILSELGLILAEQDIARTWDIARLLV
jgi:hypothetical protein